MYFHTVVWLDHHAARIIGFDLHSSAHETLIVESHGPAHLHHKAGVMGSGHAHDDHSYFAAIAEEMKGVREILIVGPADAKVHLQAFLRRQHPELAVHVVGSEAMGRQGDAEIVKFAHDYFQRADRMTSQR
jgi:stalled ribosome rescue protein Dom34